jgi:hypothetical protein
MIAYTFKKVIKKEDGTPVEQKLLLMLNAYEDYNVMVDRHPELKGADCVGQYNPDFVPEEVPLDTVLSSEQDSKKYYIAALEEGKRLQSQIDEVKDILETDKIQTLLLEYRIEDESTYSCLMRILEEYDNLKKSVVVPELENTEK